MTRSRSTKRTSYVGIRLEDGLKETLERIAYEQELTVSQLIRQIVKNYLIRPPLNVK